jgi:hypothetical protein
MSETRMRTMSLSNADTLPVDPPAQALKKCSEASPFTARSISE